MTAIDDREIVSKARRWCAIARAEQRAIDANQARRPGLALFPSATPNIIQPIHTP
jgi:hypothetical protein